MKRRELILLITVLGIITGTAGVLKYFQTNQRLGEPGIKSSPIEGTLRRAIEMPLNVPGYEAKVQEIDPIVVNALPEETSMAQVIYTDAMGQQAMAMAVMMGTDRTSIHKPQFCLTGQGWAIDESRSSRATVRFEKPVACDLPVMKLVASRAIEANGQKTTYSGIYVYWFVAENALTEDHWRRMWWMAKHLVSEGELQRWAYISYFMPCAPGQEEAAFERVKKLITATAPEFQLVWPSVAGAGRVDP